MAGRPGREDKAINLVKFLRFRDMVNDGIMSRKDACRALEISVYMYKKWDAKCKDMGVTNELIGE